MKNFRMDDMLFFGIYLAKCAVGQHYPALHRKMAETAADIVHSPFQTVQLLGFHLLR